MERFGLVIKTKRTVVEETAALAKNTSGLIEQLEYTIADTVADRDAANKQIERLLHNSIELTLLWAAVRECGQDKRVRVVYDRLMPKGKG